MPNKSSQAFRSGQVDVRSPSQTHGQDPFSGMWQNTIDTFKNGIKRIFPGGPTIGEYGLDSFSVLTTPYAADAVPEPNPQGRPESTTSSIGAAGTAIYSGFVTDLGEYKASLMGNNAFPTWEQMRRSDPDVYAGLLACKLPVRAAQYQIIPGATAADPNHKLALEIAKFVEDNLFGGLETMTSTGFFQTQSFEKVIENALLMLDFGCACDEILWHVDGDKVRVRRLAPRLPITYFRYWPDSDGETLLALEQYGYRGDEYVNVVLPAEKINYYVHEQEGADYFGFSILRRAYQPWYFKTRLYAIDGIALERNAMGVPWIKMASGYAKEDRQYATKFVTAYSAHENTGLVTPDTWNFEIVGTKGRLRDPKTSIQHFPLALDTPVSTPNGFISIGDLKIGDEVFDEHGKVQQVVAKSPVYKNRPCYKLNFDDGSHIIADEDHKWLTTTFYERNHPDSAKRTGRIRTTREIFETQRRKNGGGITISNHAIQLAGAVEYPEQTLPIHPYIFGSWLGDGNTGGGAIICHIDDLADQEALISWFGFGTHSFKSGPKENRPRATMIRIEGLTTMLRDAGILGSKFVPEIYLRASIAQRHDLLAGLMDTDGYNAGRGTVGFNNTNKSLVDAVAALARSLGEKVSLSGPYLSTPTSDGTRSTYWSAKWVAKLCPFYLPRKVKVWEQNLGSKISDKKHRHYITSVEVVEPRDTQCITVSGDSHLFLAGHSYVPTSNSEQILRSMLAGFLAFGTTQSGSRSLGADMIGFFKMSLNALARNIATTMTNNVIRRLVDYNYGDSRQQIPYPSLSFSNIVAIDPLDLADKIKSLAQWQVDIVQPDDEIENWFRREFGMPLKTATRPRVMPLNQREMIKEDLTPEQAEQQSITEARAGIDKQNNPNLNPTAAQNTQTTAQSAKPKAKTPVEAVHPSNGKKVEEPGNQKYDPGVEPNPHRTTIEDEQGEKGKGKVSASEHFFGTDQIETIISALEMLGDKSSDRRAITCDFDGVINIEQNHNQHVHKSNEFGQVSQNAVALLTRLHDAGFKIIVTTARKNLLPVYDFLTTNHVPFDDLGNTKMPTLAYIDDRGLHIDWGENYDPAKVQEVFQKLATIAQQHGEPVEGFV